MTFTLRNCIERINQALDYPALEYTDVSHYFDQAISELNTTLRIGIRPIAQLLAESEFSLQGLPNVVFLNKYPTTAAEDQIPMYASSGDADSYGKTYYFDNSRKEYGLKINGTWTYYDRLYAIFTSDEDFNTYVFTTAYYSTFSVWTEYTYDVTDNLDLTEYLPVDVIILFVIPYVCFKFTVRDGGDGQLFREEFIQGFQQIQTSYDIPNTVVLATVAGKKAYVQDVNEHANNLTVRIPLRAIYDSMKIGNAIMPEYGGFYENGGWGL